MSSVGKILYDLHSDLRDLKRSVLDGNSDPERLKRQLDA